MMKLEIKNNYLVNMVKNMQEVNIMIHLQKMHFMIKKMLIIPLCLTMIHIAM